MLIVLILILVTPSAVVVGAIGLAEVVEAYRAHCRETGAGLQQARHDAEIDQAIELVATFTAGEIAVLRARRDADARAAWAVKR